MCAVSETRKAAVAGVKWMTVSTFSTAIVAVLRLSVLTRFLAKADFGIVAILTFILGLTQTFADLGFASAIMHKQGLSRKEFASLYWIQLLVFVVLYVVISLFSPLISDFYKEPTLTYLLPLSLLDLVFYGVGRLYDTVLQKELKFKTIAIRNIVCSLISLVLAVILAVEGFGVYSLVLSTLFQTFTNNLWNAVAGQKYYKLQFVISIRESILLIKIGVYQMGTQIVDYFSSKFDILIIGKLLGTELLGIYSLAKELASKIILLINTIANRVILPFFSKLQGDDVELRKMYIKVIRLLAFIGFPVCVFIGGLSMPIVAILYGNSYKEIVPLLSILTIWSCFVCIGNPVGNLAIAKGRTDISFKYTLVRVFITIPIVYVTSLFSVDCVAWGQILLSVIMFFVVYKMLIYKLIGLLLKDYVMAFGDLMAIAIVIGGVFYGVVNSNLLDINDPFLQLVIYGILLLVVYVGVLLVFQRKMFFELFKLVRQR